MRLMNKIVRKVLNLIERRPLVSFFSILGLLLILIIAGNFLRQPKPEDNAVKRIAKEVDVYGIGVSPKVQVSAKVEKSGVVTLVAQTSGVVQAINKVEGNEVYKGEWIFSLSTNYQGGNVSSLSRQIAEKNYEFVEGNYDTQKQMIDKRRDIANSGEAQAAELRDITSKSIDDTKSLISLNEEILNYYDEQIKALETSGGAQSAIITLKATKSNVLSGLSSLRSALRNSEYQSNGDQEPAHIARVSRDLTLQQLEIEEKSLKLNKEISKLNLRIAQVSEALMYPATPVAGTVERIYVRVGDVVNPGTKLATITGSDLSSHVVALVSGDLARSISRFENSVIKANGEAVEIAPLYVSSEPTDGQLHSVLYILPPHVNVSNGSYVTVEIPVSKPHGLASVPYVPLDAVYQTQSDSYLFVAVKKDGKYEAQSRTVSLGGVVGSYVEVKKGLNEKDQVIINRDVVAGDLVNVK